VKIMLVGNVEPQYGAVYQTLAAFVARPRGTPLYLASDHADLPEFAAIVRPDLIVVAGWRRLIPPDALAIPRYGTVGFHSAKLPEYPGRAPVPWTFLRGDTHAWNTMLYLDEGVDSGDIIDEESRPLCECDTPTSVYRWVAESDARMLRRHLPALLAGTAPRTPQDPHRRGPLTTADGWDLLNASRRSSRLPRLAAPLNPVAVSETSHALDIDACRRH
jgi:methionyl-tRNA formyltransferase